MKAIRKAHNVDFWEWDMTWNKEEALQSLKDFFKSINHNAVIFSSDKLKDGFYIESEYARTGRVVYGDILVIDGKDYLFYSYYEKNKFKELFGGVE
jgi:hypothetical protein